MLERAASKAAHFIAFDHPGSESRGEEVGGFIVGGGDEDYANLYRAVVTAAGDYHFFCTAHTHCADGQKVKVSATIGCPLVVS